MFSSSRQNRVADIFNKVKFTYIYSFTLCLYVMNYNTQRLFQIYLYDIMSFEHESIIYTSFSVYVILLLDEWR